MENTLVTEYTTTWASLIGLNEIGLVLAAQKGDLEAFNQLVILYQDRIYNLALRILGDEYLTEDITQNTFLIAYRSLPGFRNGSFRSWLYRITVNACYDELRRRKKHPVLSLEDEDRTEERLLPLYDFPTPISSPGEEYERLELEEVVQQALSWLDAGQRAVVVLVDLQGFDYIEAAQVLGIPIGTVKSRLARARLRLRHLLSSN